MSVLLCSTRGLLFRATVERERERERVRDRETTTSGESDDDDNSEARDVRGTKLCCASSLWSLQVYV